MWWHGDWSHGNTETVTVLATSWHLARILFVFCDIIWGGVGGGAGRGRGGAGLPVSRGSAQHPTPSSAVLMKTRRGAPASRAYWRHGHTFSWRHMWGPDIRWWSLYLCLHRLLSLKWWSVSPSGHTPHMLSYAEQPRYAPHLALIAPRRTHQPIALLCVIRKRKLSFAAHFPHLPAAAARLVT